MRAYTEQALGLLLLSWAERADAIWNDNRAERLIVPAGR